MFYFVVLVIPVIGHLTVSVICLFPLTKDLFASIRQTGPETIKDYITGK